MKKYAVPQTFYSDFNNKLFLKDPIVIGVRGKRMEYGREADHVVAIIIDRSEYDEFTTCYNKILQNQEDPEQFEKPEYIPLALQELKVKSIGKTYQNASWVTQQTIMWRVKQLQTLQSQVEKFSRLFAEYHVQRKQKGNPNCISIFFGAIPKDEKLLGVEVIRAALKATEEALKTLIELPTSEPDADSFEGFVKTLNQILDDLKDSISTIEYMPALQQGTLNQIFEDFKKSFEIVTEPQTKTFSRCPMGF